MYDCQAGSWLELKIIIELLTDLVFFLTKFSLLFIREKYGRDNVIMSDIAKASWDVLETGEFPSVSFFLFTYLVYGLASVVQRVDNSIH